MLAKKNNIMYFFLFYCALSELVAQPTQHDQNNKNVGGTIIDANNIS